MKKKLLITFFAIVTALCCALGFIGCTNGNRGDLGGSENVGGNGDVGGGDNTDSTTAILEFNLNVDRNAYSVSGIQNRNSGTEANIPATYNNLPVTAIGRNAFWGSKIAKVTIPDSVTSIGESAFEMCHSLSSITLPNYVTTIGKRAFMLCSTLSSINIPNKVTSIGEDAFSSCAALSQINIPASVESIGNKAFNGCASLNSITVEEGNTKYHSAGNCLIETERKILISGSNNSIIPNDDSVTVIESYAFYDRQNLTSATIPDSVTVIGDYAFWRCSSLENLIIGNNVISIGSNAFVNCHALKKVIIPDSVISIGESAFVLSAVEEIIIGSGVTSIGKDAFNGCNALKSAMFKNVNGWSITKNTTTKEISNVDLEDSTTATECLINNTNWTWSRS